MEGIPQKRKWRFRKGSGRRFWMSTWCCVAFAVAAHVVLYFSPPPQTRSHIVLDARHVPGVVHFERKSHNGLVKFRPTRALARGFGLGSTDGLDVCDFWWWSMDGTRYVSFNFTLTTTSDTNWITCNRPFKSLFNSTAINESLRRRHPNCTRYAFFFTKIWLWNGTFLQRIKPLFVQLPQVTFPRLLGTLCARMVAVERVAAWNWRKPACLTARFAKVTLAGVPQPNIGTKTCC